MLSNVRKKTIRKICLFIIASIIYAGCAAPTVTPADLTSKGAATAEPVAGQTTQPASSAPAQNGNTTSRLYYCQENTDYADGQFGWRSFDILSIGSDGSEKRGLTRNEDKNLSYTSLAVSPDGSQIAYALLKLNREKGVLSSNLYVMNSDGSAVKQVSVKPVFSNQTEIDSYLYESAPAWSPDGTTLAFVSNRHTFKPEVRDHRALEIFTLNLESGMVKQVTFSRGLIDRPSWSPDGQKLAFMSDRTGNWNIFVMDLDGSEEAKNLNNSPEDERWPAWSPDGGKIAFHSNLPGSLDVYTIGVNGTGLVRVTDYAGDDFSPAWSPDGSWLAFISEMSGSDEIYLRDLISGNTFQLTTDAEAKAWLVWGK